MEGISGIKARRTCNSIIYQIAGSNVQYWAKKKIHNSVIVWSWLINFANALVLLGVHVVSSKRPCRECTGWSNLVFWSTRRYHVLRTVAEIIYFSYESSYMGIISTIQKYKKKVYIRKIQKQYIFWLKKISINKELLSYANNLCQRIRFSGCEAIRTIIIITIINKVVISLCSCP